MEEIILIYTKKNGENKSQNIRKKKGRKCNGRVESKGEIKKVRGKGKVGGSVTVINREKKSFF